MVHTVRIPIGELAMPWLETDPMVARQHVAPDLASGWWTMPARWARYGLLRNTGYHWRERFLALGVPGWLARRRAPRSSPNEPSPETIALILAGDDRPDPRRAHTRRLGRAHDADTAAAIRSHGRVAGPPHDL